MDKYEYKIKEDEIKELVKMREFEEAAEVADTIDWRRVKSVKILCMVSDVYKKLHRYEDSRDMLLLAYERHPSGRTIVYSLCELAIKMGDTKNALEYCKEFIQLAPKDPGRYILQYKLYVAQEVRLEERISVLEELKSRDYLEKWAYELAYLYHQIGMGERCVEECDEMIVWFGEGRYVIKAMELKMLYQPLTPEQQEKYDNRFTKPEQEVVEKPVRQEKVVPDGETRRIPAEDIDIQVKPLGLGQCDTINLQAEVAAGLQEYLDTQEGQEPKEERDIDFEMANTAEFMMGVMQTEEIVLEKKSHTLVEEAELVAESETVEDAMEEPEATEEKEAEETVETAEEKVEEASFDATESVVQQPENLEWQAGEMAKVLSVEGDGQISFVVPEAVAIEKQITGQMNFSDIMLEWERMKLELEEKRKENVRQMVLKDTDSMFTEFEASVRDDLLEQLENGKSLEEILNKAENLVTEDIQETVDEPEDSYTEDENGFEKIGMEELAATEEEIGEAEDAFEELGEIPEGESEAEEEGVEEIAFTVEDAEAEEPEAEEEIEAEEPEAEEEIEAEEPEAEEEIEAEEPEAEEEAKVEEPETEEIEAEEPEAEEEIEAEEPEAEEEAEVEEPETEEEAEVEELEAEEEADAEEPEPEEASATSRKAKGNSRNLTKEERELFAPFIQGRESKEQLIRVLDTISLAAYTGNVVITGREGLDTIGLARSIVRNLQQEDTNFSGKVAKISGNSLNKRNVPEIVEGLINGALIVQRAGDINEATAKNLYKVLQQETRGIVIILEGSKRAINAFFEKYSILEPCFNARIDMEALSNEALVNFAKKYAREQECSIDEFGMLALYQTIAERQTSDHAVTIMEVKDIMDAAIESANRKTLGHFFSILAAKRYDEEDMIIIREKDFM